MFINFKDLEGMVSWGFVLPLLLVLVGFFPIVVLLGAWRDLAYDGMAGKHMNPTVLYWIGIAALCIFFPPLLGFVLGVGIICAIYWFWMKVLGG